MMLSYLACVSILFFGFSKILRVSCSPILISVAEEQFAGCQALSNGFVLSGKYTDGMYKDMVARVTEGNCVAKNMHFVKRLNCKQPLHNADCNRLTGGEYECTIKETKMTTVCLNRKKYIYSCYKPGKSAPGMLFDFWIRITTDQPDDCIIEGKKSQLDETTSSTTSPTSTEATHVQVTETPKKSMTDGPTNNSPPYNGIIEFLQQHKVHICDDTSKAPEVKDQLFNYVSFGLGFLTAFAFGFIIAFIAVPTFHCLKRKQYGYKRQFDNIDVQQTNI